ncbi:GGDEF domain-containing protein [Massilia sp. PAMC28688]|uniref:GGDEF domain-containing protein n=1 Tax=Massilia sp. PAMC28688 TaxID=2861283 RepID=UPI001C62F4A1|nr:GGDEF domain-containing protein [Massilia sp. PAMC28688]QYF93642.1 GGDEF domain-containing protein [Massilia sp. PAMC28688]
MDITTMVFALALGNVTLCAALFFYQFESPRSTSLSIWSIAKQCQAAAWLLLYFRGNGLLPDPVSLPVGYAVLFAGVALEGGALWEGAGRLRWRRTTYPLLALGIVLFFASYYIDELGLRKVAASLILGLCYLSLAAAMATGWRDGSMLRRFLVLATTLLALVVAARGVMVLTTPVGWGWLTSDMLGSLSSAAFFMLMILGGFGFLLLSREQLQQELARLEMVDPLTDVPNRRGFFDKLAPWMALARRPGLPTALVLIDLDGFKRVNDSYGHPAGDAVLSEVVEVCKRQLRDSDQLGRLVGAEFALLLPRTGAPEALLVAERMRAAIAGGAIKTERAMISLTASFGVTLIRADDNTVSLFKRAEEALAQAKQAGRNCVMEAAEPQPA